MKQSLDHQIQHQLRMYLANRISLSEFEQWFVENSWDSQLQSDHQIDGLVGSIELLLAEYSNGDRDESYLLRAFTDLSQQGSVMPIDLEQPTTRSMVHMTKTSSLNQQATFTTSTSTASRQVFVVGSSLTPESEEHTIVPA